MTRWNMPRTMRRKVLIFLALMVSAFQVIKVVQWHISASISKYEKGDRTTHNEIIETKITTAAFEMETTEYMNRPITTSVQSAPSCSSPYCFDASDAEVIGKKRNTPGFLTIGIPTIKRRNGTIYVLDTLQSIIGKTSDADKQEIVVVLFVAEFEEEFQNKIIQKVKVKYTKYLESGFLQVMRIPQRFYPTLIDLKRNFRDSNKRVQWRSKQNADFGFMFLYSMNVSQYYIQLEDDVTCAFGFYPAIKNFIMAQRTVWSVLDFSSLGFIGKLFRSVDLIKLGKFMLLFYDEQPVDWLIRHWMSAMSQPKVILRKPTLFQHHGLWSSLQDDDQRKIKYDKNKKDIGNTLKDKYFLEVAGEEGSLSRTNPPGTIETDLIPYKKSNVRDMYNNFDEFWARGVMVNSHITVTFDVPVKLSTVMIVTGDPNKPNDFLHNGTFEVSLSAHPVNETEQQLQRDSIHGEKCTLFQPIGNFTDGMIKINNVTTIVPGLVHCVRVRSTDEQADWLFVQRFIVQIR